MKSEQQYLFALTLACVVFLSNVASGAFPTQIIARTRGPGERSVPLALGGGRFVDIEAFSFNGRGDLLFAGLASTLGRSGVYRVEPAGPPEAQTFSFETTTTPGERLGRIVEPTVSIGAAGTAFLARSDSYFGAWVDPTGGAPTLIARAFSDDPLTGPGLGAGVVFQTEDPLTQAPRAEAFSGLVINDANTAAFRGEVRGNVGFRDNKGIWLWENHQLQPIARTGASGSLGPQLADGAEFTNFSSQLHIDDLGRVGFSANAGARNGVWLREGAANTPILVSGTDGSFGPGLGPGVEAATAFLFGMTDDGVMAIGGQLNNSSRSSFIIRANGLSKEVIALAGESGPSGAGFGDETWRFVSRPAIASNDQLSFSGELSESGPALWKLTDEGVEPFAIRALGGSLGPGLGEDVSFSSFVGDHTINRLGQTAFTARLRGEGVDGSNDIGLWVNYGSRNVLVAREGDILDTDPTDAELLKQVSAIRTFGSLGTLSGSGGEGGAVQWLNDAGKLAYLLEFTDGSVGLYVTAIPEPASAALLLTAVLFPVRRRRVTSKKPLKTLTSNVGDCETLRLQ